MKLFRLAIFLEATVRKLTYPAVAIGALIVVIRVSNAKEGFWSPQEYGLFMLAFGLSGLAVALIRLGDGRFDLAPGKAVRRGTGFTAGVWLAAFALTGALALAFAIAKRLPELLDEPRPTAQSQNPALVDTKRACAKPGDKT